MTFEERTAESLEKFATKVLARMDYEEDMLEFDYDVSRTTNSIYFNFRNEYSLRAITVRIASHDPNIVNQHADYYISNQKQLTEFVDFSNITEFKKSGILEDFFSKREVEL